MVPSILFYTVVIMTSIITTRLYQKNNYFIQEHDLYKLNTRIKIVIPILIIIMLPVFFASIRSDIGTDYFYYELIYNNLTNTSIADGINYGIEPLYVVLNYLSNLIAPNQVWFVFFLSSIITMYFLVLALKYYQKDMSIAIAMFIYYMIFFFPTLNIQRQMIAVSVVLFSFQYVLEKKPIKFFSAVIIAALFHNSAIVTLPFYFLNFKHNKNYLLKKLSFFFIILLFPFILPFLFEVGKTVPFLSDYFKDYSIQFIGLGFSAFLDIFLVLIPIILYGKNLKNVNQNYEFFINLSWLILPLTIVSSFQTWAFRLRIYVTILQIIVIPIIINLVANKRERKTVIIFMGVIYILLFIVKFIFIGEDGVFPFRSFLQLFNFY